MPEQDTNSPEKATERRTFEFDTVYANNAHFEASVWDLKVIFGQLEQHTGQSFVDWHTAVTMPWLQAKIWSYYLLAQVLFHEAQNGALTIPARVMPPPPTPPSEDDPLSQAVYPILDKWYRELFGGY